MHMWSLAMRKLCALFPSEQILASTCSHGCILCCFVNSLDTVIAIATQFLLRYAEIIKVGKRLAACNKRNVLLGRLC
jgi:hypothetical protein